jgi:hypothetical protein
MKEISVASSTPKVTKNTSYPRKASKTASSNNGSSSKQTVSQVGFHWNQAYNYEAGGSLDALGLSEKTTQRWIL